MDAGTLPLYVSSTSEDESSEADETSSSPPAPPPPLVLYEEVWRWLPRDLLLNKLLLHLPLSSLSRLRSVSQDWNSTLSSQSFLLSRHHLPPHPDDLSVALIPFSASHAFPLSFTFLDPSSLHWHTIPLDFLPFPTTSPTESSVVSASPSGLLLLRITLDSALRLVVCNPITKSIKLLPPLLRQRVEPVVSLVDFSDSFSVVVAGDDFTSGLPYIADLSSEIYDPETDAWTLAGPFPAGTALDFGSVFVDGNLYVPDTRMRHGAVRLNLKEGLWGRVRAELPEGISCPRIAGCDGRVFLVGAVAEIGDSTTSGGVSGLWIWMLCDGDRVWMPFGCMRRRDFERMMVDDGRLYFWAVGHGNLICLIVSGRREMVCFDIETKKWRWIPMHPSASGVAVGPSSSSLSSSSFPVMEFYGCPFRPMLSSPID